MITTKNELLDFRHLAQQQPETVIPITHQAAGRVMVTLFKRVAGKLLKLSKVWLRGDLISFAIWMQLKFEFDCPGLPVLGQYIERDAMERLLLRVAAFQTLLHWRNKRT